MGVLDGEVTPTIYYGLPHELTLAAKVEEGSAVSRRGHGDWEEGSLGFIISFSPTHTHTTIHRYRYWSFPSRCLLGYNLLLLFSPSVFDSFAVFGRAWDNTANTEMVNLCKRAISNRTLSGSMATSLWTCGLQLQRTLGYRHRQGRSEGKVDVVGGP